MKSPSVATTLSQVFEASQPESLVQLDGSWWGFGGIHGGLALSLLTIAMQSRAQGCTLRQVSGEFRRPLREPFTLDVLELRHGKTASWLEARACSGADVHISARGIFARDAEASGAAGRPTVSPPMPDAPQPLECPTFVVPSEFVPFAARTEIRPVGDARPFGGTGEPELMAWLRLLDDDIPPDDARLIVLMDALAPAYSAMLDAPVPIPTVILTVTPGEGIARARSPWVLLRARTHRCGQDGWLLERFDAWAPDRAYLGSAEQLRIAK